jgi:hypothetical protein
LFDGGFFFESSSARAIAAGAVNADRLAADRIRPAGMPRA